MPIIPQSLQQRRPQIASTVKSLKTAKQTSNIPQYQQLSEQEIAKLEESSRKAREIEQKKLFNQRIDKLQSQVAKIKGKIKTAKGDRLDELDNQLNRAEYLLSSFKSLKGKTTGEYTTSSLISMAEGKAQGQLARSQERKFIRTNVNPIIEKLREGEITESEIPEDVRGYIITKKVSELTPQTSINKGYSTAETRTIVGYDIWGQPQYQSISPEQQTPEQKFRTFIAKAGEAAKAKKNFRGTSITAYSPPTQEAYKPPTIIQAKILINEYKNDPQAFIRKYGSKVTNSVVNLLDLPSKKLKTYLTQQQELQARTGVQEFFGGRSSQELLPYEEKGTAVVTNIKFYTDKELNEKYPFATIGIATEKQKAKLNFETSLIIDKYANEFKQEFNDKINHEVEDLYNNLKNKVDNKEISVKEANKQYGIKTREIIKKYEKQYQNKIKISAEPEIEKLTKDAQTYINLLAKDAAVQQAIALAPVDFLTGAGLTIGLGSLGIAGRIGAGLIGVSTFIKTPEIISSAKSNPLAFGIRTSSFLAGGFGGSEVLRIKAGEPTITGKVTGKTIETIKKINNGIDESVERSIKGEKLYSFSDSAQILNTFFSKKKKKKTANLDKVKEELLFKQEGNTIREKSFQEKLTDIEKFINELQKELSKIKDPIKRKKLVDASSEYLKNVYGETQAKSLLKEFSAQEGIYTQSQESIIGISKQKFFPEKVGLKVNPTQANALNLISKELTGQREKEKLKSIQMQSTKQKQITTTSLVSSLITKQASNLSSKELTISKTGFSNVSNFARPQFGREIKETPKTERILPFKFMFPSEEKLMKVKSYYGYVKEGKKWRRVTPNPSTKQGAIDYAARVTDNSISARGKVVPIKKKIKGKEKFVMVERNKLIQGTGYYSRNMKKFRTFQQKNGRRTKLPNSFIERQRYRLDSPMEIAQLQTAKKGVRGFFGF